MSFTSRTLGQIKRSGQWLSAHCRACDHWSEIDIAALVGRFGEGASAIGPDAMLPERGTRRPILATHAAGRTGWIR